jgi:hypothetical protein
MFLVKGTIPPRSFGPMTTGEAPGAFASATFPGAAIVSVLRFGDMGAAAYFWPS